MILRRPALLLPLHLRHNLFLMRLDVMLTLHLLQLIDQEIQTHLRSGHNRLHVCIGLKRFINAYGIIDHKMILIDFITAAGSPSQHLFIQDTGADPP
ncbi:hypothetical protein D3C75_1088740 [compost metagenome]